MCEFTLSVTLKASRSERMKVEARLGPAVSRESGHDGTFGERLRLGDAKTGLNEDSDDQVECVGKGSEEAGNICTEGSTKDSGAEEGDEEIDDGH